MAVTLSKIAKSLSRSNANTFSAKRNPQNVANCSLNGQRSRREARGLLTESLNQSLSATRILPYPAKDLYEIVADIGAYQDFVPYCSRSTVTEESEPESTASGGRRWPAQAELRIGYDSYDFAFSSRVYCQPYRVLEAVAGSASTTIPKSAIGHYRTIDDTPTSNSSAIESLITRWTFDEFPFKPMPPDEQTPQQGNANANPSSPRTQVGLAIEVNFSNPMLSMLLQATKGKIAGLTMEAFEARVRHKLGPVARSEC